MADLLAPFAGEAAPALAAELRAQFGSLAHALSAPRSQWRAIANRFGDTCELIVAARDLIRAAEREQLQSTTVDPSDPELLNYLRSRLCHGREEHFMAIYCDQNGRYLVDEEMGHGTSVTVAIDPAHLFRRALTLDAASLVLAHNHPSGDCRPSEDDVEATRKLAATGRVLGFEITDHLILTSRKAYSMRAGRLL